MPGCEETENRGTSACFNANVNKHRGRPCQLCEGDDGHNTNDHRPRQEEERTTGR